jgi:DamX protein
VNANYSELQSRLNHLVNYSSQLIFVSSDSIAEQHRTLEAFMSEQSEQTEVAFISAKINDDEISYRRQLCRQLIGQVAGSFVRPLNELLVSLNHHDGPVLIGITQAHFISNSFLQELWNLVLQSRFAANKQHLNIVLFGDTEWAEKAQAWLPAKNTATPLLLSSESIDNVQSELEQLIAQKRAAFQRRIEERNQLSDELHSGKVLIRKPWFSLLVIGLFIASFAAILSWQYPERMKSLVGFGGDANPVVAQETASTIIPAEATLSGAEFSSVADDISPSSELESVGPQSVGPQSVGSQLTGSQLTGSQLTDSDSTGLQTTEEEAATLLEEVQAQNPQSKGAQSPTNTQNTESSVVDSLLVSNWQQRDADGATTESEDASSMNRPKAIERTEQNSNSLSVENTSIDYPVLPQLPSISNDQFVIQIAGLQDLELAAQYIGDQNLEEQVWVYQTQRYGGAWYVIVYSEIFDSLDTARAQIPLLPLLNPQSAPFVKSGSQVNAELNIQ